MIIIKRIRIKECSISLRDKEQKDRLRQILKKHFGGTVDFEYDEIDK